MSTKIEWCEETWNPIVGCTKCSPGCLNCYAERMAHRLAYMGKEGYAHVTTKEGKWNGNIYHHFKDRLDKPLHWRKPRRIFICSMSDLFHPKVPFGFIDKVHAAMISAYKCGYKHTYLILTKRPKRMLKYYSSNRRPQLYKILEKDYGMITGFFGINWPFPNLHLGVSISNQAEADVKISILLQIPVAVRWLSIEPMLSGIDISRYLVSADGFVCPDNDGPIHTEDGGIGVSGVIVGGESGPGARPMHPDWPRSIRNQCVVAGVSFYFKQWGAWEIASKENAARNGYVVTNSRQGILTPYNKKKFISLNSDGSLYRDNPQPNSAAMARVGKKKAGDLLDGRKWKQLPK